MRTLAVSTALGVVPSRTMFGVAIAGRMRRSEFVCRDGSVSITVELPQMVDGGANFVVRDFAIVVGVE